MKTLMLGFILTTILVVGCSSRTAKVEVKTLEPAAELPTNATDVKDLGNGWFTFRLVESKIERKFLAVKVMTSHGFPTISVTELK